METVLIYLRLQMDEEESNLKNCNLIQKHKYPQNAQIQTQERLNTLYLRADF